MEQPLLGTRPKAQAKPATSLTALTLPLLRVRMAADLEIDLSDLPSDVREAIVAALEFPNPEREQAMRERVWGADKLPKKIKMWEDDRLPRGFAEQLHVGLTAFGVGYELVDERTDVPIYTGKWKHIALRDYQEVAADAMAGEQQGIWQAPPASGKTVTVLELIRRVKQRSVVITNKTEIAYQWQKRAKDFLDVDVGILGDGGFDVRDITVAMQQTLWARIDELTEAGFWDMFGLVCLDECHHLPAATFMETVQRFSARYRLGVSGTPGRHSAMLPVMEAAIGPVFHVTQKEQLVESGVIGKPRIEVVPTGFRYPYWPTHDHDKPGQPCRFAQCTCSRHKRVHRNNYTPMMGALVTDAHRNRVIADEIKKCQGRTQLVLSRRLGHLRDLKELCLNRGMSPDKLVDFTGKQSGKERAQIAERAMKGDIVLFSTVADEALDIPALDTLHLAYPASNIEIVKQIIGRIERVHAGKGEPLVIDYRDDLVSVLDKQFKGRWRGLYVAQQLTVDGLDRTSD